MSFDILFATCRDLTQKYAHLSEEEEGEDYSENPESELHRAGANVANGSIYG
jgi:hypothetical protein